ncbi:MAG: NrpR regulatory domain-containing protein [Thermodesulfovibrionales bacterium]|nr:NrpR regulatory domain-containing protein [Thermodesulfovibrionales bacterium]
MTKTTLAILKILEKHRDTILGSREISRQMKLHGVELTERTVRYHMKILDERGLTKVFGKEGRKITDRGREELSKALVSGKVGFVISKIETLSYLTTFDIDSEEGDIILNVSYFPQKSLREALKIMNPVFHSPYVMSDRVVLAREGEKIGEMIVPEGMIGLGTICSVTINGIFLKAGIPVASKFGGLLEIDEGEASRFLALISYEGTSLDPLVVFIRSRMTAVTDAVKKRSGNILASFREIPVVSMETAKGLLAKLSEKNIGGLIRIGNPNQPFLEMPVGIDKTGMAIVGGLNPVAALEEAGIRTESTAMAVLHNYSEMPEFKEAAKAFA